MHLKTTLLLAAGVLLAACEAQDPIRPDLDDLTVTSEAKPQRVACRAKDLKSVQKGKVKKNDCLFEAGGNEQREDLYRVDPSALGLPDFSGTDMLTFTGEADFDAIFGLGKSGEAFFPDPVYAFSRFDADAGETFGNSFSFIGSSPEYRLWFGGQDGTQLGTYTLTTTVEASIDTCENGHWVFLQGEGAFSSDISNETSCRGQVNFGPNVGAPLNYQFWYVKLLPGETFTATLDGATDESVVLAAIDFGTGQAELDFADGPGDGDRAVSFTATRLFYLYVEVSTSPDVTQSYTLAFDGP